jgi:hypothetical protein
MAIVGNTQVPGIAAEASQPQVVATAAMVPAASVALVPVEEQVQAVGRTPGAVPPEVELVVERAHQVLALSQLAPHTLLAWMPQQ